MTGVPADTLYHRWLGLHAPAMRRAVTVLFAGLIIGLALLPFARWGLALGKSQLEDYLWSGLTDTYAGIPMGMTAENLAEQYKISQEQVDEFSLLSQKRFAAAQEAGRFAAELAPVELKTRNEETVARWEEANAELEALTADVT